jgi:hypothetical protein
MGKAEVYRGYFKRNLEIRIFKRAAVETARFSTIYVFTAAA